jgi:HK97 family phage major capsid protein
MNLKELLQKSLLDARAICDQAETETRDFTAEERTQVGQLLAEAKRLKDLLKAAAGDAALRAAVLELGGGIELAERPAGRGLGVPPGQGKGLSLGAQVIQAPEFQSWLKRVAPNGYIPESAKGLISPSVAINSKQLITGLDPTSAGAFINPDYTGIYESLGRYPLTLRDLIALRQTTSDTVEFVRQTVQVTQAAPTPEANVKYPSGATGEITGTKPQGHMNFERVTETVKTVAVYVGATKRALSDAAQIRGIIDQELREDLVDELETQLLTGNGLGENFTGLANQPGTLIQAWDTNALVTTRRAITTLLVVGRQQPTAFLIHPTDWEGIDLLRDLNGNFLRGNPFGQGPNTLWGVPVVQSFHLTPGSAWLANWRKAVLWDREQATVTMTDSHDDWFIRNLVAVLAELRAAFGLIRPSAFVNVDLTP